MNFFLFQLYFVLTDTTVVWLVILYVAYNFDKKPCMLLIL